VDTTLGRVTPVPGKGALGEWRASPRTHRLDTEPGHGDNRKGRRAGGITRHLRGVYRRVFNPRDGWEGPLGICCCCQPDSGKPTVRDERGAYGNVNQGGTRHPPYTPKGYGSETLHLPLRAPYFYPTGSRWPLRHVAWRPRRMRSAIRVRSYAATARRICQSHGSWGASLMGRSTHSTRLPRWVSSSTKSI
jgi:hypothetical protein